MLRGEEMDDEVDEMSGFELAPPGTERPIDYNPALPIETFDFVVTDECHRSIYGVWRQVLEYFDAFIIGLTATPSKHTLGFFNQNLVAEYPYERSVADGVNVGYEVYRITTRIGEQGGSSRRATTVPARDRRHPRACATRNWMTISTYTKQELDRSVLAPNQIRTVLTAYRDSLPGTCFPAAREVPKTLDLRQGRPPRRGDRHHRPRGVRQGQRFRQEDHLSGQRRNAQGPDRRLPPRLLPRASPSRWT